MPGSKIAVRLTGSGISTIKQECSNLVIFKYLSFHYYINYNDNLYFRLLNNQLAVFWVGEIEVGAGIPFGPLVTVRRHPPLSLSSLSEMHKVPNHESCIAIPIPCLPLKAHLHRAVIERQNVAEGILKPSPGKLVAKFVYVTFTGSTG